MHIHNIIAPIISLTFLLFGSGFFITFITVRSNLLNISQAENGLYHSAYYTGLIIGAITVERLIIRIGHIRAYAAFASATITTVLLQAIMQSTAGWIILRFIAGICFAALYVIIESWLLAESDTNSRGKILAVYMGTFYCAIAIGQFLLKFVNILTLEPYFVTAILCSISVIPVAITFRPSPALHEVPPLKIMQTYDASPYGFIGCICSGLVVSSLYSFLPSLAYDKQLPTEIIMFSTILGGFILQWPIGVISDLIERRKILIIINFAIIIPCILLITMMKHALMVYILCFTIGGLSFVTYPICIAKVCDNTKKENILSTTGVLLLVYGIGCIVGPLIVPVFYKAFTISTALCTYVACISGILGIIGIYGFAKAPVIIYKEEASAFVPMPTTATPIVNELDPRTPQSDIVDNSGEVLQQ